MLAQTVEKYVTPQLKDKLHTSAADLKRRGDHFRYYSMPLTHIHLYSNLEHEFEANGHIAYVVLFTIIAVLILLIACVNFINLTIARSLRRLREIGVRKILGSNRRLLAGQFLMESLLMTAIAMGLALVLVVTMLPWFHRLTGKPLHASFLLSARSIISLTLATFTVGLLSGGYPAFLLSGIQPLKTLRGQLAVGFRMDAMRTVLLVFQFSTAMILIIGTAVIYTQLSYIRHRDPGYTREQVVTVKNTSSLGDGVWTFADEARKLPGVVKVAVSGSSLDQKVVFRGFFVDRSESESGTALLADWHIDANYLPTLNMKLIAGRNFSPLMPTDSNAAIINETAARVLGYTQPLGKKIYTAGSTSAAYDSTSGFRIIGVVKDFNVGSLRDPVDPVVFRLVGDGNIVLLRISPKNIAGTLTAIQNAYQSVANGQPFVYSFLDDDFNRLYLADQRTGNLFSVFSILAIFIAGMGMFGLVAAAAEQRTKELGIRRVLGARLNHLWLLLLKDYGLSLGVAILIALPVGAWTMHNWLQGFAYRTELQPWIFLLAPLCAVSLAVLIVIAKAHQTTRVDLAKTLRVE
jgi:putative ABC transport system permease protein